MAETRSLRDQVRTVLIAALVLVTIGGAFSAFLFVRLLDARHSTIDRIDPADVDSQRLLAALVDQETGVRGFVLTRDASYLDPYQTGLISETQLAATLAHLLQSFPTSSAAFEATRTSADGWHQQYATPTIDAIRSGNFAPQSEAALAAGKSTFDGLRQSFAVLDTVLSRERTHARERLDSATYELLVVLGVFGLLIVAGGIGAWYLFRLRVQGPLTELGNDARLVSGGQLDHEVRASGPTEIAVLGTDVDMMRRRILDELLAVSKAGEAMEQQARALARSNAELEQFAYVASHDLQEPLRKVASFCGLLQSRYQGQLDERADQYIDYAVDGAKRMQALINDLLAFSRVGRSSQPMTEVDCNLAFTKALDNLSGPIEAAGAHVTAGALPTVSGHTALIIALFQNLVGNGIKFRRPGQQPTIAVTAALSGDSWTFSVADDGIGIEPRYADRVFTIFQRLHAKEEYEGTGIGLALCRKIVEDHGGRIWIEPPTETQSGTTICFTMPALSVIPTDTREVSHDHPSR